jgi:integrase
MQLLPALGARPRTWDAQHIREVIVAETKRATRGHVKKMASALRGYVRFLGANGRCRAGLEHAVPIIAQWRLSSLPRYIDAAQVEQLIATCDPTTPIGLRDWDCAPATSSRCTLAISIGGGPLCPCGARDDERRGCRYRKMPATPSWPISSERGRASRVIASSSC